MTIQRLPGSRSKNWPKNDRAGVSPTRRPIQGSWLSTSIFVSFSLSAKPPGLFTVPTSGRRSAVTALIIRTQPTIILRGSPRHATQRFRRRRNGCGGDGQNRNGQICKRTTTVKRGARMWTWPWPRAKDTPEMFSTIGRQERLF